MRRLDPRLVVRELGPAVLYVSTQDRNGDLRIATSFHVGDNWFVTARHVVADRTIVRVGRLDVTERSHRLPSGQIVRTTTTPAFNATEISATLFHPDERADIAIFRCPTYTGPMIPINL